MIDDTARINWLEKNTPPEWFGGILITVVDGWWQIKDSEGGTLRECIDAAMQAQREQPAEPAP